MMFLTDVVQVLRQQRVAVVRDLNVEHFDVILMRFNITSNVERDTN